MRCRCGYLLSEAEKICPNCGKVYDKESKNKELELKEKYRRHASVAGVGNRKPDFKKAKNAPASNNPFPNTSEDEPTPVTPAPPVTPVPPKEEPPKTAAAKTTVAEDNFMFEDYDENMLSDDADENDMDDGDTENNEPSTKINCNESAAKCDTSKERVINNTYTEKKSSPEERIHKKQRLREEKMEVAGMEYYSNRNGYYDDTLSPEPPQDDVIPIKAILKWTCGIIGTVAFIVFLMFYA